MSDTPHNPDQESRVNQIIADYLEANARGEAPEPEVLFAQHPDLADSLREFFVADKRMR